MQKLKRLFLPVAIGLALLSTSAPAYARDNRDAGVLSKMGSTYVYSSQKYDGVKYSPQNEGGFTVYVPYDMTMTGQNRFYNMFTKLFDIYSSSLGENYTKGAGLYDAPGTFGNINGIQTRYFAKYLSTTDDDNVSAMATSNLGDFCPNFNIEYRYCGIMIDVRRTNKGTVVTNPTFASDFIQEQSVAGSKGTSQTYTQYNKAGEEIKSYNLKLIEGEEVKHPKDLIKNWTSGSGIPDNVPTASPYFGTAQKVFEAWAEKTEIGAKYKEAYQSYESAYGKAWWQILQEYVRIDGDLDTQSVLLTMVYHDVKQGGHVRYKTYYIPFPIQNNVIAYSIQIIDDKGEITEKSERPLAGVKTAVNGADIENKNIITGKAIELKRNKTYQAQLGLMFASTETNRSATDKMDADASPQIQVWVDAAGNNGGMETDPFKVIGSANTSDLSGLDALEQDLLDSSRDNTIRADSAFYADYTQSTETYHAGLAGYNATAFTVDETFPAKGHLRFIVPQVYTDNGDNEYKEDDMIDLDFVVVDDSSTDDPEPEKDLTGDMNLGRREYRRLHYKKTVEEDDTDKPIMSTDPTTGEKTPTGEYEKKLVDYEYATDFNWYETYASSPDGEKVGDWNGVPEASGSIYPIDDHSWWEYDQQWPDQGEDAYYKIWLTKAGTSWSKSTETYYRSETADYPFTLGFSTSRSRGQESDQINPKIKVQIYGISPDTDEDGELISTQIITGNQIGTYQYSANNYMYLTDKYIAARYGNDDYPRIRVHAEIDKTTHGESGIYGDSKVSPYQNGWQDEHDTYDRTFNCISDDMEITDIMVKDSEGIVVYHAKQDGGSCF